MGFFSWKTSDTHRSISNSFSVRGTFPVYLVTPDDEKILETCYEGYGIFGGHDAYALLARWNRPDACNGDDEHDRLIGIQLDEKQIRYPLKFSESEGARYEHLTAAETCEEQGYFYD